MMLHLQSALSLSLPLSCSFQLLSGRYIGLRIVYHHQAADYTGLFCPRMGRLIVPQASVLRVQHSKDAASSTRRMFHPVKSDLNKQSVPGSYILSAQLLTSRNG